MSLCYCLPISTDNQASVRRRLSVARYTVGVPGGPSKKPRASEGRRLNQTNKPLSVPDKHRSHPSRFILSDNIAMFFRNTMVSVIGV